MITVRARRAKSVPRKAEPPEAPAPGPGTWTPPGFLLAIARVAGIALTVIALAATVASLAESYRGLFEWSVRHDVPGIWAAIWPLMVDTFMVVAELALLLAIVMRFPVARKVRAYLWSLIGAGVLVSVAGNVGHLGGTATVQDRLTAAVPPVAAWAALSVGFLILREFVSWLARDDRTENPGTPAPEPEPVPVPARVPRALPLVPLPLRVVRRPAPVPAPVVEPGEIEALLRAMAAEPSLSAAPPAPRFEEPAYAAPGPGRVEVPDGFDPWKYGENSWLNPDYRALSQAGREEFVLAKAEYLWGELVRDGGAVPGIHAIKTRAGVGDGTAGVMRAYLRGQAPGLAAA